MSNQWLRLYAEFATDPKVQMMSEAYQRRYLMLLCLRCSNGHVTLHDAEVAFQLRISDEEWLATKAVFLKKNLIDDDNAPTSWDRRQFCSDSSAARVAAYRARGKMACNGDVTLQKRQGNVTVTRSDTDTEADPEADSDSETEADNVNTTCAEPVPVTAPAAKSAKPSFDFSTGRFSGIRSELIAGWSEAYPAINARQEIAKAAAWLMANPKNRKSDYGRFLNAWLSRAQDSARPVKENARQTLDEQRKATLDELTGRTRNGIPTKTEPRDITGESWLLA